MNDGFKTESERLFATYLEGHAIDYIYEPDPAGPDFAVQHGSVRISCEVTERERRRLAEAIDNIRARIKGKSRQGASAKGNHPYVLVMHFRDEQNYDLDEVLFTDALFGTHTATFEPDDETGQVDVTESFGRGGRLQARLHTRFSAVASMQAINPTLPRMLRLVRAAWGEARTKTGTQNASDMLRLAHDVADDCTQRGLYLPSLRIVRLLVFHNPHAQIELSRDVFVGPYDVQWAREGSEYRVVSEGRGATRLRQDLRES